MALWALRLLPLAVIAFAGIFGVQTIMWWKLRQFEKKNPVLWVTPQNLRDIAPAKRPGLNLSTYGYEFEVPWTEIDTDKTRSGDFLTVYYFRSGPFMMFANPERVANAKGIFLEDAEKRKVAMQVWGEKTLESNYTLTKTMLETSPAQMTIFTPRRKVLGLGLLLMLKAIPAAGGETGIFVFETPTVRGFQMGNPEKSTRAISVRAFDMGDRQLELTFGMQAGSTGQITQAELNRVLQTVRRVPSIEEGPKIAQTTSP
jgi:hypothetical protein